VNELLPPERNGQAVELLTPKGRSLGTGIYNGQSQIVWRRFAGPGVAWDRSSWEAAIDAALARRTDEPTQRLIWSEADDFPGLVVDRFDSILAVQALTLAVDRVLPELIEILLDRIGEIEEVVIRNDAPSREHEGLPLEVRTHTGRPLKPFWCEIRGLWYHLDLSSGQKTGYYLDQRDEHLRVAAWAENFRVLDAFCNQGAFALQCAAAGAREVIGIDSSGEALRGAAENAKRNKLDVSWVEANCFDWLSEHKHEKFDLIVLDPPAFAPHKRAVEGALRGYKQLHLRALRMLTPGGILATYACSQHITRELFLENLTSAAVDTGRRVQLLEETGQPLDHPVRLGFPESAYLKGMLVRVE
jgi:23S rRNA (cytosine1962-C5)-methyltransferase